MIDKLSAILDSSQSFNMTYKSSLSRGFRRAFFLGRSFIRILCLLLKGRLVTKISKFLKEGNELCFKYTGSPFNMTYNPLPRPLVLAAVVLSPRFLRFLFKFFLSNLWFLLSSHWSWLQVFWSYCFFCRLPLSDPHSKVTLDLLCLLGLYFSCITGLIKCGQLNLARLPQLNPKSVAILDQILNFSVCLSGLSAITDFKCFKKSVVFFEFTA